MTGRRRGSGRAPFVERPWMWGAAVLLWAFVGYLALEQGVPARGVAACLAFAVACAFAAGRAAGEQRR